MHGKLKAAIIGYGKMGKIRRKCVEDHSDLELVAICDCNPNNSIQDVPFEEDYEAILYYRPDVVFVCTPNKFLSDIVCYFLNNKVHVFCEKPPGSSKQDIEKMAKCSEMNPEIKLKFGFNHRYHQSVLDARSIIEKGRLGKILWMRGIYGKAGGNHYEKNWRNNKEISGGGILIDQGIHMVDLFTFFCGDFLEVKSFVCQSYWKTNVEDNVFAILRNGKGQIGMLHSSATQWRHQFLLDIFLEKGYVTISGILSSTNTYAPETLRVARCEYDRDGYPLANPDETVSYYENDQSWKKESEEFIYCILHDKPIQVGTCQEAYNTMELIEKVYEADRQWMISNGI